MITETLCIVYTYNVQRTRPTTSTTLRLPQALREYIARPRLSTKLFLRYRFNTATLCIFTATLKVVPHPRILLAFKYELISVKYTKGSYFVES